MKIGKYTYTKSSQKGKKLSVIVNNKKIHFGNIKYEHFRDKTGIWEKLNHNNETRRKNYLRRSAGIKDKNGKLTKDNPNTANYHARRILWNSN
tara:strand:- start:2397 stop:2675 length:279 start_codon:yes stop_codon:yes gene_type:complete